ncbi:MAG: DUF4248 domain-containing protein [Bacteroidaceae bacterium]|nr:DUF4248 domain-containing protein [Bacteroidaceae bacterium]
MQMNTMQDKTALNERLSLKDGEEIPFRIKPYPFGRLAMMYYPDHHYDSALRHFRAEMHLTRGMWEAMQAVGYKEYTKQLTRSQVKVIVEFLGEP